jgi:hypothetical protein
MCQFYLWKRDDYGQLIGRDFGSFGLPFSTKKTNDQVSSFFYNCQYHFCVLILNFFARIIVYVLNGLFQFCWWFQIFFSLCEDAMAISSPPKMGWNNVPSTSNFHNQSKLQRSPPTKVSRLHAIFLPQWGVLVAKWASGFRTRMWTNFMLTLRPQMKDFLTSCLSQFEVYIWSTTWRYNIDKHLDEIKDK